MFRRLFAIVFIQLSFVLWLQTPLHAEDKQGHKFYTSQVEPIFAEHCFKCHGNGKNKGGLTLYTRDGLLNGGDSGPAVDLDDPELSTLLDALNYVSYEMPPSGKLPQTQIETIAKWVKMGAPMPERDDAMEVGDVHGPPQVNEETRNHWAFRPIERPEVPGVSADEWVQNPIDAFVLSRLETAKLTPNAKADKRTLVRRLYYNLTGLPPSPQEVEAFVNDTSPDAYETLLDELLASPHYGEHWARYWLDLVRYAESNSFERDNPKPYVWKYRDYVIRSFNQDKPYDQFVQEQLAGDEITNVSAESIIATGFYRLGAWDDEPADPKLAMYDEFDDIVATTAQGMLGLSMNCARCHDHKLDPIPQADYYSFVAFFRNVRQYGIRSDASVEENSVRSIATPEQAAQHARKLDEHNERVNQLRKELDQVEKPIKAKLEGGERDDFKNDSVRLRIIRSHVGKLISRPAFEAYEATRKEWRQLRDNPPEIAAKALAVTEHGVEPPATHILVRGNPDVEGDVVDPAFPAVLTDEAPEIAPISDNKSSGRRLALAKWMTSEENPLTPRVIVNRIWQWNFGRGLVRTPNNFGLTGDFPTHPELLDWLSAEFLKNGWSIKQLTKMMLMSNTWQMSSGPNPEAAALDPLNDLYWRFDMRRLRAEEIRDSLLAVNGTLNAGKMYGPSIYPTIPEAVLAGQSRPGHNWHQSSEEDVRRRSIYIHIKRSLPVPLLASFDVADTDFTCPVRFATTQPTQALGMLNSDFLNEQAKIFAEDLGAKATEDLPTQVRIALKRVFQRPATDVEVQRGLALIESLKNEFGQTHDEAVKNFCLMALNLNEFLYLD